MQISVIIFRAAWYSIICCAMIYSISALWAVWAVSNLLL